MSKTIRFYNLRKQWAGFSTKYHLPEELRSIYYLLGLLVIVWLFGSILTAIVQWVAMPDKHQGITDYLQYFWIVIIELVSSEPGGNVNLGFWGQLVTVLILLMGVVVVGIFTGKIITVLVQAAQRRAFVPSKPQDFQFKNPILICGNNRKIASIIGELNKHPKAANREIVVVHPGADSYKRTDFDNHPDIWIINDDPANRDVLKSALGSERTTAILLAPDSPDTLHPDVNVIRSAVAIEGYHEKTHTVLEIIQDRSANLLIHTKANEWIAIQNFTAAILAQAIISPTAYRVYKQILGISEHANESERNTIVISETEVSSSGIAFKELRAEFARNDAGRILIGLARLINTQKKCKNNTNVNNMKYETLINPDSNMQVLTSDKPVYIRTI
jgi:hypothetical protein